MDLNQNDLSSQVAQAYKSATGVDMPSEKLAQRVSEIGSGQTSFGDWQTALQASDRAQLAQAYKAATGSFADQGALESLRTQYQSGSPTDYSSFISSHIPSSGSQLDTGFGADQPSGLDSVRGGFAQNQDFSGLSLADQISGAYKQATGFDMSPEKLQQRVAEIGGGQTSFEDYQNLVQNSPRASLSQLYYAATGQMANPDYIEGLVNQVKSGQSSLSDLQNKFTTNAMLGGKDVSYFDPEWYLKQNQDVAQNAVYGGNPLQHYLNYGKSEGRLGFEGQTAGAATPLTDQIANAYRGVFGKDIAPEDLLRGSSLITSGKETADQYLPELYINQYYNQFTGRDATPEEISAMEQSLTSGDKSWNDIISGIAGSKETEAYQKAHPVSYFGDIYARDENGNLIRTEATDYYGGTIDGGSYQRGNYGFDTGMRSGENWDQYQTRINNYFGGAVGKMFEGILGRQASAEELNNIAKNYSDTGSGYNTGRWTDIDLQRVQRDLALSPEAQANAAKNGTWLTLTKDETRTVNVPGYNYSYEVTEPATKAVYIPPSVAGLPEAMRQIYNSGNPQALIDQIKNDPTSWMKNQLADYAYTVGVNQRVAGDGRNEAWGRWSYAYGDESSYDRNAQMQKVSTLANDTAKWLLDNKAITPQEIADLWKSKTEQGGNDIQHSLDTIHEDDGGWMGLGRVGDAIGDFQEKYQLAIMASILGGAVLGPLAGAAAEFGGGAALAGATGAGAALPSVSTLAGYAALAGTAGATATATSLAMGAPTNKALLAGGLAAAGVGLGGALGPSGLNLANTLTNAGMPSVLSAVTVGALSGGALGALSGAAAGDVGAGALGGALAGGITSGTSAATKTFDGMTGTLARFAAGTAVGMLTGKDISAALQGAAVGTVVGLAGSATKAAIDAAKSGKTDIDVSGKITPNAETVSAMRKAAEEELNGMLGNSDPNAVKKYVESLPESYFTEAIKAVDVETANAIKTAASYPTEAVKELYKQETGTEPSAEKLAYWSDELRNGTSMDDISAGIKATANVDGVIDTRNIEKFASTMSDLLKDTQGITDLSSGTQVAANTIALKPGMGTMIDIGASGLSEILPVMKPYVNDVIRAVGALVNPVLGGMAPTELGSGDVYETGTATGTPTIDNPLSDYVNSLRQNWGRDIDIELKDVRAALENVAINENRQSRLAELNKLSDQELGNLVKLGISESVTSKVINPAAPWNMGADVINPADVSATDQAGKVINPANVSPGATNIPDVVNPANPVVPTRDVVNPTTDRPTIGTTDVVNPAGDRPITDTGTVAQPRIDGNTDVGTAVQARPADLAGEIDRVVENAGVRVDAGVLSDAMVDALARSRAEALSRVRVTDLTTALINRIALVPATTAITTPVITKIVDDVITEVTGEPPSVETPVEVTTPTTTTTTTKPTTKTTTPTTKAPTTSSLPAIQQILKPITGGSDYKAPEGHEIFADVVGGPAKIDLGGRFGAPTVYNLPNSVSNPAGGLVFASGGSVNFNDLLTFDNIAASLSSDSSGVGEDIVGGTNSSGIDIGAKFGDPIIYALAQQQQQQKSYAEGGMVMDGYWPNIALAQQPKNRFKYLHSNLPKVSADAYAEGGHVPEFYSEGGLNNRYVTGNGDGTSDDIPAMLANGEFVIPADVVSALGNGSNDSGAQVLDELLQVIRAHKQNHDPKELPPDSMGPLAYLNKATKKVGK